MGSIYKRGNIWWVKYSRNGKPYYESSRSTKETDGRRLLRLREGEIEEGKLPGVIFSRIRFDELAEDFLTDYRINQRKSIGRAELSVNVHLKPFFRGMRVTDITTAKAKQYINLRMETGAENGTINRELAALKRMFNLAAQCTPPKVAQVPYIPMLKENNVRKGFFEHQDYLTLLEALPAHLRPVVIFAYHTGWRKSEILGLTWDRVDLDAATVRLEVGETKNDQGRTIYLDAELQSLLKAQMSSRRLGCKYVFHQAGKPVKDFRGTWATACEAAGIQGKLFHDFRRTAVRNMIRAGIPERVAMMVSDHKTRTVFDRYNIVDDRDLKQAAAKQEAYLRGLRVTKPAKVEQSGLSGRRTRRAQLVDNINGARGGM
jgi:integrase